MDKPNNVSLNDWLLLKQKYKKIDIVIKKINKGYPIQYLIGFVDFFGCKINVNKNVLIPRFETELLVEIAINKIKNKFGNNKLNIIDFGTGSGCIAIKLAKELLNSNITAIDKSQKALNLAQINAKENKCKIKLIKTTFKKFKKGKYDVLISNPPYISVSDLIDENVKKYEPKKALFAKEEGLFYYKQILNTSKYILNPNNLIFFEFGYNQKELLKKIIDEYYPKAIVIFSKDYNGFDRYCIIENNV